MSWSEVGMEEEDTTTQFIVLEYKKVCMKRRKRDYRPGEWHYKVIRLHTKLHCIPHAHLVHGSSVQLHSSTPHVQYDTQCHILNARRLWDSDVLSYVHTYATSDNGWTALNARLTSLHCHNEGNTAIASLRRCPS